MKNNRMKKADLFLQTRRKLTFSYSWLIIVFLLLFASIVSVFFLGMTYREQRQSLQNALYAADGGQVEVPHLLSASSGGLYFMYFVGGNGNVIAGSDVSPDQRNLNLKTIEHWNPHRTGYRLKWLPESHSHREAEFRSEGDRLLFVGARPYIMEDGKKVVIYAAKDVTFYLEAFQNLLIVLFFIFTGFIAIAVWLSYSMSKKAMIPIQRAYRQQQQFLADASHELRTPLSIMNTSLEVIEFENGSGFTPYTSEVMSDMQEEIGRMSGMVQHLLMLARSDAGAVEFQATSLDLVPKIRQWVQAFEAAARQKRIMLVTRLPEKMAVHADIERLKQLVYILLDNAIKYTEDDGTVDVMLSRNQKQWVFIVQDSGIGIPENERKRIFDRFYRVEAHRSRDLGSAGLGLSIAKWIVEVQQGSIEVESSIGEGSKFIVKFPLV
ncbi:sensor histidine kinase [Cohnella sp. GCM10020058]|uniref:sensor histidine kinase n=1 Tax=Cohnella sp. GCM10020058 TaxID=3317330 RepID=UPI003643CF8E